MVESQFLDIDQTIELGKYQTKDLKTKLGRFIPKIFDFDIMKCSLKIGFNLIYFIY